MRILAFHSGTPRCFPAVFENYRLIAAIQEERLRRERAGRLMSMAGDRRGAADSRLVALGR